MIADSVINGIIIILASLLNYTYPYIYIYKLIFVEHYDY